MTPCTTQPRLRALLRAVQWQHTSRTTHARRTSPSMLFASHMPTPVPHNPLTCFITWGNVLVAIAHIFISITHLFALKLARSHALQLAPITPIAPTPPPQQRTSAPHERAHSPPHFFHHLTCVVHIRSRRQRHDHRRTQQHPNDVCVGRCHGPGTADQAQVVRTSAG